MMKMQANKDIVDNNQEAYFEIAKASRKLKNSIPKSEKNSTNHRRATESMPVQSCSFGRLHRWSKPKPMSRSKFLVSVSSEAISTPIQTGKVSEICDTVGGVVVSGLQTNLSQFALLDSNTSEATATLYGDLESLPLSYLLAEYGDHDFSWRSTKADHQLYDSYHEQNSESSIETYPIVLNKGTGNHKGDNRLGLRGKAPIHVEFISFGYHYGAPSATRNCWSYSQPLSSLDTRTLIPQIPAYLNWKNGLCGHVKYVMLAGENRSKVLEMVQELADEVAEALVAAMNDGGHGFISPLCMTIYIGSEQGRHRSVVITEMTATAVRNRLRSNLHHAFTSPCSVGTHHLHIERKQASVAKSPSTASENDLEDDE